MSLGEKASVTIPSDLAFDAMQAASSSPSSSKEVDVPKGATVRYEMELVSINGRQAAITAKELETYQEKCNKWAAGKIEEFDADPEIKAKKSKKYEGRDGYKDFLEGEVAKKLQAYEGAREFAELVASGSGIDKVCCSI